MANNLITRLGQLWIALDGYKQALVALESDPQKLLPTLLARDQVDVTLQQVTPLSTRQLQSATPSQRQGVIDLFKQLVEQDAKLRQEAANSLLVDLPVWRQMFQPADDHWWWFLDQADEERTREPKRLAVALDRYEKALGELASNPQKLLVTVLARDEVDAALKEPPSTLHLQQLVTLDGRLRQEATNCTLSKLSTWRESRQPPDGYWWWKLDQAAEEQNADKNLLWFALTAIFLTLMGLTILPALQIVSRLWEGAPDIISVFGTLFALLLAASPFTPRARQLAQEWLVKRIPGLNPSNQAQVTTVIMALIACVVMLTVIQGGPWLAKYYYNQGFDALDAGDIPTAQQNYSKAVAFSPQMAVGYYELAFAYEKMARPDDAIIWYRRALEEDRNLSLAYNNLGRLHILQGEPKLAMQLLLAGLPVAAGDTETELVARYQLLFNLGWAYYVLEQPVRAREALEQAITLESQLAQGYQDYLSAIPHYYLALIYEALEQPDAAIQQWEESLRYVDRDAPDQIGWEETIRVHLNQLRKE